MGILHSTDTAVFALGGLGEVGKNLYCIEHDDSLIIIDSGVLFPEGSLPGIDYVIPNYSHLIQNQYKIKALLITHGHEDHIGGIPFLLQKVHVPIIYAPKFAAALIKVKLEDAKIRQKVKIIEVDGDTTIQIDNNFTVDFFYTTHSIPDSLGIAIDTPNGRIVTTGDFKIDLTPVGQPMDIHKITKIGKEGVDLLLADSTNAEVDGISLSERSVISAIREVFSTTYGRLIIATFASNIHRIQQIVETAVLFKRKICVFGRSMERAIDVSRKYGYIKCPDTSIILPDTLKNYRPEEILILCTGSQGEQLAALPRIANGTHKYVKIFPGDTIVLSSSAIPGNQQSIQKVVNQLYRLGANVVTNSILTNIHASGHASKEELKFMLSFLQPKYFMPVHGEYRMLKIHAELAQSLGIPKENTFVCSNGDTLLLNHGQVRLGRKVEVDEVYVDGKDSSGLSTAVIHDRRNLSSDGVVSALISMDSRTNTLLCTPRVVSRGFMHLAESEEFMKTAGLIIEKDLNELFKGKVTFNGIKNTIRNSLAEYIYDKTQRTPMIIPVIMNKRSDEFDDSPLPNKRRKRTVTKEL